MLSYAGAQRTLFRTSCIANYSFIVVQNHSDRCLFFIFEKWLPHRARSVWTLYGRRLRREHAIRVFLASSLIDCPTIGKGLGCARLRNASVLQLTACKKTLSLHAVGNLHTDSARPVRACINRDLCRGNLCSRAKK